MEINVEILFLVIGYVLYRWGKKHGIQEGRRESWRDQQLQTLEDFMYDLKAKKDE